MDNFINIIKSKIFKDVYEYYDILNNYDFSFIKNCCIKNNKKYARNIIFRNEILEIILIKWSKGSETMIHNHPKNGCIFKLIKGHLKEFVYDTIENRNILSKNDIYENDISYINPKIGLHKIFSCDDSISIHIYSPPNYYKY